MSECFKSKCSLCLKESNHIEFTIDDNSVGNTSKQPHLCCEKCENKLRSKSFICLFHYRDHYVYDIKMVNKKL